MVLLRYARYFLSCLLAFTGGHTMNYAVVIYAQDVLGSDLMAGIGFGLCFGPPIVLGWLAGVACDRVAPARLIHAAQALFLFSALLLGGADAWVATPGARLPWLLLAAFVIGVAWSFASPARMAALAQVALPTDLKAASVALNLLVMIGFGLGPVTIAFARELGGWTAVFTSAAALFALSSLILLGVRTFASGRVHESVIGEIREGVQAVLRRPLLAQLMLAAIIGYLALGPMQVLLPRLARTQLGLDEVGRGSFLGMLALALIGGGLLAMLLARRIHNGAAILGGIALTGIALAAMSATAEASAATALLLVLGVGGGLALSLIVAGIQTQAEPAVRGRVLSLYTISSQVVPAASGVAAGALAQAWGVGAAVLVCGGVLAATALLNALWMDALRRYRG